MKTLLTASKITLYLNECIAMFDLVEGVKTIGNFVAKVEDLAVQKFPNAAYDEKEEDKLNAFKGDMLEILAEIFFTINSAHPAVGITDYTPVSLSEDYGVDATGTNVNGDLCAAQVKYRNNPVALITYEDMSKTFTAGKLSHCLPLEKNDTVFLFTTGEGITSACENVFGSVIRVINRRIIAGLIDNNQNFWQETEELILNTLDMLNENSSNPLR